MRANGEVVKTNIIYIISASIFTFECLKIWYIQLIVRRRSTNDYYFRIQTWLWSHSDTR